MHPDSCDQAKGTYERKLAQNKPQVAPQVDSQIRQSNHAVDKLSAVIGELEQRLMNVMRDPSPVCDNEKEQETLVPVAHEIRNINEAIQTQVRRIEDYINRLEI